MNRRKVVKFLFLAAGATAVSVSGYKWYGISKKPALDDLAGYKELLSEMAETLIPATDTPGAKDALVGDFIYKMVMECTDKKSQNKFLTGLSDLEAYSKGKYGQSFIKCTTPQREAILSHFEQKGKPKGGLMGKIERRYLGNSFYSTLKNYTVTGYCTSEPGAKMGLAYDYIPKQFVACIIMYPSQRSWATK